MPHTPLPAYSVTPRSLSLLALLAIAASATITVIALPAAMGWVLWSDITVTLVVSATAGCIPALFHARTPWTRLLALSLPCIACACTLAAAPYLRALLGLTLDSFQDGEWTDASQRGALLGAVCAAIAGPIVWLLARAHNAGRLDNANKFLTQTSAWLLMLAFAGTALLVSTHRDLRFHFDYPALQRLGGRARLVSIFDASVFAASATAIGVAFGAFAAAWDVRRVIWLHAVVAGKDTHWRVVDRTVSEPGVGVRPLILKEFECDGVLVREATAARGPFREARVRTPVALIPTDPKTWRDACRWRVTAAAAIGILGAIHIAAMISIRG